MWRRFKRRFPRLLHTDYWTRFRAGGWWSNIFGNRRSEVSGSAAQWGHDRRWHRTSWELRIEALETRALLAAFTPGDLVVLRVGDGVTTYGSTGTGGANGTVAAAAFFDEYTPGGQFVQTIALPTAVSGSNLRVVEALTGTSEGGLTRSANGQYLVFTGFDAAPATTNIAAARPEPFYA